MTKTETIQAAENAETVGMMALEKAFMPRDDGSGMVDYDSHFIALAANCFSLADALLDRARAQ